MQKVIFRNPTILTLKPETMEAKKKQLEERLGFSGSEVAKIICKAPNIVALDFSSTVEPKLVWLEQTFQLDQAELGKVIWKAPALLNTAVDCTLEPTREWLQQRLKLDFYTLRKIVISSPTILALSHERLEQNIQRLEEELQIDDLSDLGLILAYKPQLLSYSVPKNLQPTLIFFEKCIVLSSQLFCFR